MMKPYLCGLISASIIVLTLSDATARFLSAPTVGVFVRKEKNCQIKWFDETEACDRGLLIRDGTIINTNKKLDKLSIQWKPAEMVDKIKLEVTQGKGFRYSYFVKLKIKNRMKTKSPSIFRPLLADLLKFERTAAKTSSMATRGEVFISIPEENATILSGQPLTFSWCDVGGTALEIRQGDDGSLVKSFPLKQGARAITIRPSDLQLTMGKRYTWNVKGLSKGPSVLNMLGPDEDKELSALLGEIEQNRELSPG